MMRRLLLIVWLAAAATVPALAFQPPAAQSEYVPVKDLPPVDQLPAAPLLVAAYSFIWLVTMFYLWTIWRRLGKVESEMHALEQRRSRNR
jgi:CcmD family protein